MTAAAVIDGGLLAHTAALAVNLAAVVVWAKAEGAWMGGRR